MLIGVDASKTALEKKTGIDKAAYQIILNLKKLDSKNTYYLYSNKPVSNILKSKNFIEKLIPFPRFWNRFRLPLALIKDKPNKFLELTSSVPPFSPKKTAVFLHDLAFKIFPEAYSQYELLLQETAVKNAIARAERIIFSSEANKKDFLKFYQYPEDKIKIAPLAYEPITAQKTNNKNAPYLLFVGRLEKRKNIENIIESFNLFKKWINSDHSLLLVGKEGYGSEDIIKKIDNSPYKKNIKITGYLNDKELAELYVNAQMLIFPSLYEGFGIPILEAFSAGIPVITSNIPTLKEVAADSALFVNPTNPKEIAKTISLLENNKKTRNELISKGKRRAKDFSWEKCAKEIKQIIEEM